jgi:cell division protein FtsA
MDEIIVALDIGTAKIVAIVAVIKESGEIEIQGVGSHISKGLKKGVVDNIELTVQSINRAVEEAELMAGISINSVYAGVAGSHIEGHITHGMVPIKNEEVSTDDIDRVMNVAKIHQTTGDKEFLHALQQDFCIDGQSGIKHPQGMAGTKLEVNTYLVYGATSAIRNLKKCINKCNLVAEDLVLEQLASSYAVLSEDEKDLGVCLLDIGGGTTDIAVFKNGALQHIAVIPIAGDQVTYDIAIALGTSIAVAEEVKKRYGCALAQKVGADETIKVKTIAGEEARTVSRDVLASTAEARYAEIFNYCSLELVKNGFNQKVLAGVVLCGGAAKIEGACELASEVLNATTRIGVPDNIGGIRDIVQNPAYATGVGLLKFAKKQLYQEGKTIKTKKTKKKKRHDKSFLARTLSWFQDNL